jgi:hypothetical protein
MPEAKTGTALQVLELLLEYFGVDGARWTRDRYDDGHGRRCLAGALNYVRLEHRIPTDNAEDFLNEARRQAVPHRQGGHVHSNDRCQNFAELPLIIASARVLALREEERARAAAAVERWLLAELERERAVKAAAGDKHTMYRRVPGETVIAPARLAA